VQVDHGGVRIELVGELDRLQPVAGGGHDSQLGLAVDQGAKRLEEQLVVVREQHLDRAVHRSCVDSSSMDAPETPRAVAVIGAGLDLGAGRRGVDMGPSAIRYADLEARIRALGLDVSDWGDIPSPVPEAIGEGEPSARYLAPILQACERVAALVREADGRRLLPLVLGGDHSIAMGTLGGMAQARGPGAVVWIDAHGDLNRPSTSPSGNVHGMPLAAAFGVAGDAFAAAAYPTPSVVRAALVGVRSLDPGERALVKELDVRVFTMSEIDRRGADEVVEEALQFVSGASFVHVSLDLDAVDPMFAPGVGTPVRGGLSYREAHLALELVSESGLLDSLEVVEVNPILDRENATGTLAVELVASALGARIL
jgi:arginase